MSNALAIAATTAALRHLLEINIPLIDKELTDLKVTTRPPDLARKNISAAQLNLFLYETQISAAWRNHDLPSQVRPGETGTPPFPINLHYLLTAYSRDDSDVGLTDHRIMASAMGLLNDHPVLGAPDIQGLVPGNDLDRQIDRVRITWRPMGVEELSKLWTIFQSQYRLSAAYEVGVVLIDSRRPVRAPLPVLARGADDRGPVAASDPLPMLEALRLPRLQSAIRLGEAAILAGTGLTTVDTVATIAGSLADDVPVIVPLSGDPADGLIVPIADVADDPDALSRWHPGFYRVALQQTRAGVPVSSNALPLALAPRINVSPLAALKGDVTLTLLCEPRLHPGQNVLLMLGDRQIMVKPGEIDTPPLDPSKPSRIDVTVPKVDPGSYVVRLRVDGVDSIPVIQIGSPPLPTFDPAQTVVVT